MNRRNLYLRLLGELEREAAAFELRQIFLHNTGWDSRSSGGETEELPEDCAIKIISMVLRLKDGYPLQYLLGEWEFYGLPFKVGPGVLIPRPDTETAVEVALDIIRDISFPLVADFCAGSGAIGIAIAKNHPGATCWALELSKTALGFLIKNIALNGLVGRVAPIQTDITEEIPELPSLDIIVSNPPYLTEREMLELPQDVAAQPAMALFGGDDGLDFYRIIARNAKDILKPGGALVFEVGHTQADAVASELIAAGYHDIKYKKDYGGIVRCVWGFK